MKLFRFFRERPLVGIAFAAAAGCAAGVVFPWYPLPLVVCAGICALLIVSFMLGKSNLLLPFCLLSFFLFTLCAGWRAHPDAPVTSGTYMLSGTIAEEILPRSSGGYRTVLRDVRFTDEEDISHGIARMYWTFAPDENTAEEIPAESLRIGDRVSFRGSIYRPLGRMNPYGFDFRLYLLGRNIACAVSGFKDVRVIQTDCYDFSGRMSVLRERISKHLENVFQEGSAWPKALLLGEKDGIGQEEREAFNTLGIAHVFAISGLHMALIGGFLLFLLRRLHVSPVFRSVMLSVLLIAYCAVLGFPASAFRAALMLILYESRTVFRRTADSLSLLSAAFVIILIFSPLSIVQTGFWMSFGAVLGMILLSNPVGRILGFIPWRTIRNAITVSISAGIGIFLPMTAAFHRFSAAGLLLSPVICLLMSFLLPFYIITAAVGCLLLPAAQLLAQIPNAVLSLFSGLIVRSLRFPYLSFRIPDIPWYISLPALVCLVMCTRFTLLSARKRIIVSAAAAAAAVILCLISADGSVKYVQLYMGQGDCSLILDGGNTIIVDTGSNGSDLVSYLEATGRNPDCVLLTHLHSDHCGGIRELIASGLAPGKVILPYAAGEQMIDETGMEVLYLLESGGIPVQYVSRGDKIQTDRVNLTVLWPDEDHTRLGRDPNLYSLTALAEIGGSSVMLTGDLDGVYELYTAEDTDILKVAHHGSAGSSSSEYLDILTPRCALIPCASGRILPSENTLTRLQEAGAEVYRTDLCGAVTVTFGEKNYQIRPFLAGVMTE